MKSINSNQSGFSTLFILLIAALVVIGIGTVGVMVYHSDKSMIHPGDQETIAPHTTSQVPQRTTIQTEPTQQATAPTYLDITQWGVELPLSSAITDAYYVVSVSTHDSNGQPNTVWLGLKSLTNPSCNPALNNTGGAGAIGGILRVLPTSVGPVTGKLYTQDYPNGVTIGGYYYAYTSWMLDPNNKCPQSSMQAADSAFATAAKSIISTPASTTTSN